ncbi:NYN domain-containing protein [Paraphoma chrysanthemicola]|uniref:NYN domain-containing protein n=1 Tax=Paraphoma chrysanthemicola TaxID=798071 RepID=A0A8K0VRV0_9PLEO|nr:NYN domain-containing protein [Paraphoma chrysanthemicola]
MTANNSNVAVLIDADNVSSKHIAGLLAEIANYGTASVKRIYGDWTSPYIGPWKDCLLKYSIIPIQQFAYTTGKNATDSAMIIDAMDLLYTGRFSSFCLVSSDSDFTRLASRIREQGVTVYGFGERKTPSPFIAACDQFMYFDALKVQDEQEVPVPQEHGSGHQPQRPGPEVASFTPSFQARLPPSMLTRKPLGQAALKALTLAVSNSAGADNWANLAEVGGYLSRVSPDMQPRNLGYDRLRDLMEASGIVELRVRTMGDKPPVTLARLK